MNSKEKAEDLFNKMKGFRVKHTHSRKCALVAAKELRGICPAVDAVYWNTVIQNLERMEFGKKKK